MSYTAKRWREISKHERISGYWLVIPDDSDTLLDGLEHEIVYVYYDGKWSVLRIGEQGIEPLESFRYIKLIRPDEQAELAALKAKHEKLKEAATRVMDAHDLEFGLSLCKRGETIFELGKALAESEWE